MMLNKMKRSFSSLVPDKNKYLALRSLYYKVFEQTQGTPAWLRLAWHDAGTFCKHTKTGGPNASIVFEPEISHGANKGLKWAIDHVQTLRKERSDVSLADWIQLGGYAAVEHTGGPDMASLFRFGRKDATEKECTPDGRLPNANKGVQHLKDVFYRMGFNDQEIVALSGAHSLGRAFKDRSGFEGNFTTNPLKFDNEYFIELLENKEKQVLKLPSDLALLSANEFRMWVIAYSKRKDLFFSDYAKAFKKLSELGYQ